MTRPLLAALCLATAATPVVAQHDHAAPAGPAGRSPYAALLARDIKALSDTQIAQLRSGEGMGFALAAELNHYPGPRHALELADSLRLTADQARRIAAVREAMNGEARRLGELVIAVERELDRGFAGGTLDSARLRALTAEIARLQSELRFTHLAAHLAVRAALTPQQVRRYDALRGYGTTTHVH
jgi:Spy/CpxP family protein refolding chaperone